MPTGRVRATTIVAVKRDGRTAVALAQSEHPDLVVLDIMLPLLDGTFKIYPVHGS